MQLPGIMVIVLAEENGYINKPWDIEAIQHMYISVISAEKSRNFSFAIRRRNEGKGSKLLLGWK
jgi:hypothetical protein